MVGADQFLADWLSPHSLAFGAGTAMAILALWQSRPAGVFAVLNGAVGIALVVASIALVLLSERYQERLRREPGYFVAGLAMGVVLTARLFG